MTTQNNFSLIVEPADVLNMGRKSRLFIVRSALDPLRSRTVEDNKVVRAVFIYHGYSCRFGEGETTSFAGL
jgi:hypothetical protein